MTFKDFNFKSRLAYAVSRAGFKEPSLIQAAAIPLILQGKDLVGQAHTGTGKTAAFALPLLQQCSGKGGVEIVVIVPTRELATQVADEFYRFSRNLNMRTATIYGGTSYGKQIAHVSQASIIVATPGRFLDLLMKEKISINPWAVVVDEADEMLNMGFLEDVRRIFEYLGGRRQTLMFSATISPEIKELAQTLMKSPEFIRVEKEAVTKNTIEQYYYVIDEHERDDALLRILEISPQQKAIIFCRTKRETARIADHLIAHNYPAAALHGDMEQFERQNVMKLFRKNRHMLLVATDVAARGIDVRDISHVINYHIPLESESYVHRIGRTGRADRSGIALMLVTPHELRELKRIQKDVGSDLQPRPLPQKNIHISERMGVVMSHIESELPSKETEQMVTKLLESFEHTHLVTKLLSLFEKSLKGNFIGKTEKEISLLLEGIGEDIDSENTKSSRKNKDYSQSRSHSGSRLRERTERHDDIPTPTISSVGGSRIVARKIY